ncbi:hypothetical protein SAMN06295912_13520 [Sphingomonas laterariae]|uniref:Uncharacterized protein n=2 Tax=Edaphosphingomonas laterariae TaxID=861865 RepID=A0A239JIH3_9SPHN|nr:hypothetical protein SAMN06295912_13520 [Sphingomonas laterariae]
MDNSGRLYSQVAAEAGVTADKAMVACYLLNLSRQGKSLDEAVALLRQSRAAARDYARDWGITFSDYRASAQPIALIWRKEKRGRWALEVGGAPIAEAESDGAGGYRARIAGQTHWQAGGSSASVSIRRLSVEMERRSVAILGVDDVVISIVATDGAEERLAPKAAENTAVLRKALASA